MTAQIAKKLSAPFPGIWARSYVSSKVKTVCGLPAQKIVAVLTDGHVPFTEVAAHRASLEEAYMELTKDAVEFPAGGARR